MASFTHQIANDTTSGSNVCPLLKFYSFQRTILYSFIVYFDIIDTLRNMLFLVIFVWLKCSLWVWGKIVKASRCAFTCISLQWLLSLYCCPIISFLESCAGQDLVSTCHNLAIYGSWILSVRQYMIYFLMGFSLLLTEFIVKKPRLLLRLLFRYYFWPNGRLTF